MPLDPEQQSASKLAWLAVGVVAVFLLIGLIVWFIWWLVAARKTSCSSFSSSSNSATTTTTTSSTKEENAHVRDLCARHVHVEGDACIGGVATVSCGLVTNHICGLGKCVVVTDP